MRINIFEQTLVLISLYACFRSFVAVAVDEGFIIQGYLVNLLQTVKKFSVSGICSLIPVRAYNSD